MFTIYTLGGGIYYREFFNSIAMLVNSPIYNTTLQIAILLGVLWYGWESLQNQKIKDAILWIIVTYLVIFAFLRPVSTIIIEDKANPTLAGGRVDNVPLGVAIIASIYSGAKEGLGKTTEMIFSQPSELNFSNSGMSLGSRLLLKVSEAEISYRDDVRLKNNFQEFIEACVFPNIEQGVPYNINTLKSSTNLWSLISNPDSLSPIFTFSYTNSSEVSSFLTCKNGVSNISSDFNSNLSKTEESLANDLFPNHKEKLVEFRNSLTSTLDYLVGSSQSSQDNLRQNIIVNEIRQASQKYPESTNPLDQSLTKEYMKKTYSLGKAISSEYILSAMLIFEIILFAFFPFIIICAIFPFAGKGVIKTYVMTFVWLLLWTPAYSILNCIVNTHSSANIGNILGRGLNMSNAQYLIEHQEMVSNMAGYFCLAIPFLALLPLKGIGAATALSNILGQVAMSSASQTASQSTTGNYSVGNVSSDNVSANKFDSSNFHKGEGHSEQVLDSGVVRRESTEGNVSFDATSTISRGAIGANQNLSKIEGLSEQKSYSQDLSDSYSKSANSIETEVNRLSIENAENKGYSVSSSDGFSETEQTSMNESLSQMKSSANNLSENTGLTRQQVLNASADIKGGMNYDSFSGKYGASLGISGKAGIDYSTTSKDSFDQISQFSQSNEYKSGMDSMQQLSQNETITFTDYNGNISTKSVSKSLDIADSYSKSSQLHYKEAQNATKKIDDILNKSDNINIDKTDDFINSLRHSGKNDDEIGRILSGGNNQKSQSVESYVQSNNMTSSINQSSLSMDTSATHGRINDNYMSKTEFFNNYNSTNLGSDTSNQGLDLIVKSGMDNSKNSISQGSSNINSEIDNSDIKTKANEGVISSAWRDFKDKF